jgi:D-amino-acid dehydrogenase
MTRSVSIPTDHVGSNPRDILVIGAGIVGVSCALHLQRDGHRVTLVDRGEPGRGTSYGNAGIIVHGASMPVGMPGMWRDVPKFLLGTEPYFTMRWSRLPRLAPWLFRLLWESRESRADSNAAALATLAKEVKPAWRDLLDQAGANEFVQQRGWLKVYETEAAFQSTAEVRRLYDRHGGVYEILNADEIRQMEPLLAPIFTRAIYFPEFDSLSNPLRVVQCLFSDFRARGGQFQSGDVVGFDLASQPRRVRTTDGHLETEVIILATGAWSRGLARQLGADIPLDTERGYHFMLPSMEPGPTRPLLYGDYGFALSPMEDGIRLAHGVELASLHAPPNYDWVRRLLPHAKRMLPALDTHENSRWLGFRPTLPDSRPVIGVSPVHSDVFLAFGHQHYGLSLGPLTGRLVADLVARRDPGVDLSPFRAHR